MLLRSGPRCTQPDYQSLPLAHACNRCCRRVHEEQRKKKEVKKKAPAAVPRVPKSLAVGVGSACEPMLSEAFRLAAACAPLPLRGQPHAQYVLMLPLPARAKPLLCPLGVAPPPIYTPPTPFPCVRMRAALLMPLQQVRVVQRNLVYVVGLPLGICREEVSSSMHDWTHEPYVLATPSARTLATPCSTKICMPKPLHLPL